ncbi:helix-turn-helix transcriptional regulator [Flagellimonas crocea]|uniref:helix-turn-helix transcriptional regulator n=1 Tax=Flagellimonas crocea TaxID=3067311 RepID=UPI00296FD66B|nr:helix-turn-helix transcriptional regulator [Muricauda sp. DH64]
MDIQAHRPNAHLLTVFRECYYIHMDGKGGTGQIPVIDDCCYDMVFFKEASGTFYHGKGQKASPIAHTVFTIHNVEPPYRIEAKESLTFFTIKLQPWANSYFFSSLKNKGVVDILDFDPNLIGFYNRVFEEKAIPHLFDMAEELMAKHIFPLTPSMELVRRICHYIYDRQGKVTVNELSEHFKRSRQYLGKVFKKEVMYSLKKFIITVRILDLVKFRAKNTTVSLTELSYEYGYFDQAHFINDFKKVCGISPLQFFNDLPEFLLRHR